MGGSKAATLTFSLFRNLARTCGARRCFFEHRPRRTIGDRLRNVASIGRLSSTIAASVGLDEYDVRPRMRYVEYHPAHLASAALVSPYDDAAVCAIDRFGDFVSTSWGRLEGSAVHVDQRVFFPHSLGLLYLAVTQYLGFPNYGDEYKVMGLAPYGEPHYVREIESW
jgi:carbamoyltransferase